MAFGWFAIFFVTTNPSCPQWETPAKWSTYHHDEISDEDDKLMMMIMTKMMMIIIIMLMIMIIIIIFVQTVDEGMVRWVCMENQYYTPRYTLLLQCISCISLYHCICCISLQIFSKYIPRYTLFHCVFLSICCASLQIHSIASFQCTAV